MAAIWRWWKEWSEFGREAELARLDLLCPRKKKGGKLEEREEGDGDGDDGEREWEARAARGGTAVVSAAEREGRGRGNFLARRRLDQCSDSGKVDKIVLKECRISVILLSHSITLPIIFSHK